MKKKKTRVLIFGAGPAGLSAGVHLLEKGGRENVEVTILNLDHMLGGKAKSWEDPVFNDGRYYDHGIHFVFGFYKNLRKFIAKAGVKEEDIFISNRGHYYWYEQRDKKLHLYQTSRFYPASLLRLAAYSGATLREKINGAQWIVRNVDDLVLKRNIVDLDDICFTAWAMENGLNHETTKTTLFRFTKDALFNWPYEISAYMVIKSLRHIAGSYNNSSFYILNDGWSSCIWDPIGEYYKELGGRFEFCRKLIELQHEGKRITGVKVGQTAVENFNENDKIPPEVGIVPGSERMLSEADYDYVISTLPMNNFMELNPGDTVFWNNPYFSLMKNLTGISPLAMFAFFKEDLKYPYHTHINGIEPPLFNGVDYKPLALPYKNNRRFGSVIHMQGQETTFEKLSDREIVDRGIRLLSSVKGFEGLRYATMEHSFVYRGRRNHSRYLLTDPGTYRFRPEVKSPFENLYLAGDWLKHDIAVPCMEGAIITGKQAADNILDAAGITPAKA